jgi:alginate O-acetyltransferase complex protein AlgI
MLGFDFMKNFDYPYTAVSATDFWRRWHISLGSWFREYVYIPLGGNRVSTVKHLRNLLVVWCLTGLWHGAAWNFVIWGLYYGVILCLEKYVLKDFLKKIPAACQHIYTMLLVMIGWMIFAAPSLGGAFSYIGTMFGIGGAGLADWTGWYYLRSSFLLGVIAVLTAVPYTYQHFSRLIFRRESKLGRNVVAVAYGAMLLLSVAYLVNATYNPFLYFRF